MGWTERQQAMLRAMGLRVWTPPALADEASGAAVADAGTVDTMARAAPAAPGSRQPAGRDHATASASLAPWPRDPDPAPAAGDLPAPPAIAASPLSAAGLDWPALREAVADCRACALCDSRRQTVFGVGHPRAHWMVVGEAPGEQEDRRGEPFVGPAGQLLDRMLAALGLTRDADGAEPAQQVYITNTLKCRPPANRNPAPDELARCEPFLLRQIELVQPRIILAMGRFAVQALLRTDEAIGRLRSRVHHYQGVPLIVTYHPAYLLRNLPHKARAWEDLCLAAATAERAASTRSD